MKNKSNLTILLFANAVSQFAQGISMIAIPWYFINQMQMTGFYNALFFTVTAATLFWSPYAGALIDRFHRKKLFMVLCIIGAVLVGGVSFIGFALSELHVAWIVLVFAFTVLNYNLHYPALYALAQEMTTKNNEAKTNARLEIQGQATSLLSGAFAALLITGSDHSFSWISEWFQFEAWSLQKVFLLDSCTYVLAFALLCFIRHKAVHEKKATEVDTGKVVERIRLGIAFLKERPILFRFGMVSYIAFATVMIHVFYLVHLYVSDVLLASAVVLATAEMFHTVGALGAGFVTRKLFNNKRLNSVRMLMATILVVYAVFFVWPNPWVAFGGCLLVGFANSGIRILRVSYLFEVVPSLKLGRVASVFQSGNILMRVLFLGVFYTPFFHESPAYTYLFFSIVLLFALYLLRGIKLPEVRPDLRNEGE